MSLSDDIERHEINRDVSITTRDLHRELATLRAQLASAEERERGLREALELIRRGAVQPWVSEIVEAALSKPTP